MTLGIGISIGAIVVLLFLSGFFSGSETALTAASKGRLHSWEKEGNKNAALVNRIRETKDRMIGALLLGNNLVNILASALATSVLIKLFGEAGVVYATLVMTMLVLIFAEVLPKTFALHNADKMSVFIAPIINVVVLVFSPITEIVTKIVRGVLKLLGADVSMVSAGSHVEVLRGVIDMHEGADQEVHDQRAMLRSILDLAEVDVEEVMIHRQKVEMLDASKPVEELIDDALKSPYTRLPVMRENSDNIIGILHVKALLRAMKEAEDSNAEIDIEGLASEPWFVPETTTLYDQLQAFRARREHFAVVVDEYGSFMGVVTLEDILEEIVGDIADEHDIAVAGVRWQPGGSYLVEGTVTIRDLNREFEWDLPDDEDYSTAAGLVLHEAKTIPEVGQTFMFYDFRFDIVKRDRNQLTAIKITPPKAA
ncbi:MAG: HlyC/CorC family transporter [Pseudomonadota bacterium]